MTIRNVSQGDLSAALALTNRVFDGNIRFNRLDQLSTTRWAVTLTVDKTRGPGGRLSWNLHRHVHAACWHAHGVLFDALLHVQPAAVIRTGRNGAIKIDASGGNWTDSRIGSLFMPTMYSEACECSDRYIDTPRYQLQSLLNTHPDYAQEARHA